MRRFLVNTNGDSFVAFVDDKNKAYIFDAVVFDEPLTLEIAKNQDYGVTDGCETAEEIHYSVGFGNVEDTVIDWNKIIAEEKNQWTNPDGFEIIEF